MTVTRLLVLQKLDLEIDKIESEARIFPDKLAEAIGRETAKKKLLDEAKGKLAQLETGRRDMDGTLKLEQERLRKSKKRVTELTKDYEIRAMQREIELTKKSNAALEEQLLKRMEEIEAAQKVMDQLEGEWKVIVAEREQLAPEAEAKKAEFEGVLRSKYSERETIEKEIDRNLLNRYRRIRDNKHRDAVAQVIGYSCQGCFMNIPPQQVNEMLRNKSVGTCPNCFRLVYAEVAPAA